MSKMADGFVVNGLPGYRVVRNNFGDFELLITGIVTFSYNSQTDRHDRPDYGTDHSWSIHPTAKQAVAKAHWHNKWVEKHKLEMGLIAIEGAA